MYEGNEAQPAQPLPDNPPGSREVLVGERFVLATVPRAIPGLYWDEVEWVDGRSKPLRPGTCDIAIENNEDGSSNVFCVLRSPGRYHFTPGVHRGGDAETDALTRDIKGRFNIIIAKPPPKVAG